jgi:CubicO group peptidase (beta-lactamase class C family)
MIGRLPAIPTSAASALAHPRVLAAFTALLLAAACGPGEPGASAPAAPATGTQAAVVDNVDARYRAFADRIAAQLQATGVPGGALAIVENGRLAFATGLGVRKASDPQAVGADTVFRIASTTKTLAAATALHLGQSGVVSLDAPLTRALPELRLLPPHDPAQLTLRRLLSHTAGIPDYLEIDCAEGPGALADWFAAHPNLVLWSPPGRLWSYSNLGFSLAGLVMERAAGAPFRDLVESRILNPLAMDTATFDVDEVLARNDYASAHPSIPVDATLSRCALTEPPGYLYASVRDLGKLMEAFLAWGGAVLHPASVLEMAFPHASTQAPPDMVYGLGLMALPYGTRLIVGHPGDLPGMHSAWWMVPQAGFGVAMLVNGDAYPPTAAVVQAIDAFLGAEEIPPIDWSTPPSDWGRYVGLYDGSIPAEAFPPYGLGWVDVTLQNDQLVLTTLEDGASYPLAQASRDTFLITVGDATLPVTFWRGHDGQAEYLATRAGHARRAAGPPPTSARTARAGESPLQRLARQTALDRGLPLPLPLPPPPN